MINWIKNILKKSDKVQAQPAPEPVAPIVLKKPKTVRTTTKKINKTDIKDK